MYKQLDDTLVLKGGGMLVEFDRSRGTIVSLKEENGEHNTNYVGNKDNISCKDYLADPCWLGDVVLRIWSGSGWQKELTSHSSDVRSTKYDSQTGVFIVEYNGISQNPTGLKSVYLYETFQLQEDGLHWDITLENHTDSLLEIGELALPFVMNTDYASLFRGETKLEGDNWRGIKQKEWHERKVMQHFFIAGHSSYVLLQRPLGDFPFLFFHCLGDTFLEAAYQAENTEGSQWDLIWEGQYLLAVHSRAARIEQKWKQKKEKQEFWFNGHTSLVLNPGQSKVYQFRFTLLNSYTQVQKELYTYGQLGVNVQPGMVIPCGQEINMELMCKDKPTLIPEANGIEIHEIYKGKTRIDHYLFKLRFNTVGQKKIKVSYGKGKWTNLFFYAISPIAETLKARARFIIERQFYHNPFDPYQRHHAFLPYDDNLETLFLESEEAWQVGGSDEYCLPIAMYLAEKNVYYPDRQEIEIIETYIDDFLFKCLQNPETYEVKRGCYWVEQYPSSQPWEWDKEEAKQTWRTFNYPLVANIYHSMYRIGKLHGLTKHRSAKEYLLMAWQTAMKWFNTGKLTNIGAPAGSNVINILQDLKEEGLLEEFEQLNREMMRVANEMIKEPYPYGSELYVDQTSYDQVHAFMKYYNSQEKMFKTLQIIKALRAGAQPFWFGYGNEKRGNVSCWYAQTLNARALLSGFEDTGDYEMLKWGHAGLISFLTTVRSSGVAHGWFTWWPDRTGFDLRSLDTDLGLYGYLKAIKSYVVQDDVFGVVGYGCSVNLDEEGNWRIIPWDGLYKRLYLAPLKIDISVEKGELEEILVNPENRQIQLKLNESTGLVHDLALVVTGIIAPKCRIRIDRIETIIPCVDGRIWLTLRECIWPLVVEVTPLPA